MRFNYRHRSIAGNNLSGNSRRSLSSRRIIILSFTINKLERARARERKGDLFNMNLSAVKPSSLSSSLPMNLPSLIFSLFFFFYNAIQRDVESGITLALYRPGIDSTTNYLRPVLQFYLHVFVFVTRSYTVILLCKNDIITGRFNRKRKKKRINKQNKKAGGLKSR